jgi:hypothetical protein
MLEKTIRDLQSYVDKMKDFTNKAVEGKSTTIMHPEVYSTDEDAKRANTDIQFRSFVSAQKEADRRLR